MKEKSVLSRFGLVLLALLALVLIFPASKIDLASPMAASTQAGVRVEHIQNFSSSADMTYQVFSAGDPAFQQMAEVLSDVSCTKKLNQNYSSYSHAYPVDSVTVSCYDAAESHQLLLTVYSDGVCIVNNSFVRVKGGAEALYQELAEIVE